MVYSTESTKWKAYEFSDPFSAGLFFVCNKINKFFCRPDCDIRPITNLKLEIKFVDHAQDALALGYNACEYCDPLNLPHIDVNLLVRCVESVNHKIGFLAPLVDDNEEVNNQHIKANILELKRANEDHILKAINGPGGLGSQLAASRRSSVPIINFDGKLSKDTTLSKNDLDHYRIVDLACRHLALAAAISLFQPPAPSKLPEDAGSPGSKKRRRRGGVLGFKELAAKSKLSAWHFHRVFKSVTGLTPKTYGDKCWEFVKAFKNSGEYTSFNANLNHNINANTYGYQTPTPVSSTQSVHELSVPTLPENTQPPAKRVKFEHDASISPFLSTQLVAPNMSYQVPQQQTFDLNQPLMNSNFNLFDTNQDLKMVAPLLMLNDSFTRAFSAPDLTKFNSRDIGTSTAPSSHTTSLFAPTGKSEDDFLNELTNTPASTMAPSVSTNNIDNATDFSRMLDVTLGGDLAPLASLGDLGDYDFDAAKMDSDLGLMWQPEVLSANIGMM